MKYFLILHFGIICLCSAQTTRILDQADSLITLGETAQAESLLQQIPDLSQGSNRHDYLRSVISMQKSDHTAAIELLEQLTTSDDQKPEYFYMLANAYAMKIQDQFLLGSLFTRKKLLTSLEEVLQLDPEFIQARLILFQYHLNAPALFGGNPDRAKSLANELIIKEPGLGHYLMALYWEKVDNKTNTERELQLSIQSEPANIDALNRLGYYYLREKSPQKSFKYFSQAIKEAPQTANVYDSMGDYYASIAQYDSALLYYEKAIENDEDFTVSHYNKARMHEVLNQTEQAIDTYLLLQKKYPQDIYGKRARQRLSELD